MHRKKRNCFIAVCPQKLILIPMFCFILGTQTIYGGEHLVPSGRTVGMILDTRGLLVLGTGNVEGNSAPCKGILQAGDRLMEANGQVLENKEMLMEVVEKSEGKMIELLLQRKGKEREVAVKPVFSSADDTYKIGAWIRDSMQGIGTVTCYDPTTGIFCALGHGVYDIDTSTLMEIRKGSLVRAELTEIIKGQKGQAGELTGVIHQQEKIGEIDRNTMNGVFGKSENGYFAGETIPTALFSEIKKGKAEILSDLEGEGTRTYEIEIEDIRKNGGREHKDMIIRVTDERLLQLTGGIVQGMGVIDNRGNTKNSENIGFRKSPKDDH